ncbi:Slp family lipoprotein [Testudinibacter sp. P27/CKL/0425]
MKKFIWIPLVLSALLSGCQIAPQGLDRGDNTLISYKQLANADFDCQCQTVRLGGKVVRANAQPSYTEIEVLSMTIDRFSAKPVLDSNSDGRFIARLNGFVDPLSLEKQYITVKGILDGKQNGKIDQADYVYPLIKAENYRIWQQVVEYYYDEEWFDYWDSYRRRHFFGGFPMWKPRAALR